LSFEVNANKDWSSDIQDNRGRCGLDFLEIGCEDDDDFDDLDLEGLEIELLFVDSSQKLLETPSTPLKISP
jgi:hypothetical protein